MEEGVLNVVQLLEQEAELVLAVGVDAAVCVMINVAPTTPCMVPQLPLRQLQSSIVLLVVRY